jgi:biopolymer transport protein ExbB
MLGAALNVLARGGPVMIPLAGCSILALAVILDRAWCWWRTGRAGDGELVLARAARGDWEEAERVAARAASPVARVLAEGLRHREPGVAMAAAARAEASRLRRRLPVLDTIVTLSPLLGLLGTVTGMIGAFGVMANTGINAPHAITGGVAEALIATAAGLAIAIGALVPYNFFTARVEDLLDVIERDGSRLELLLAERSAGRPRPPLEPAGALEEALR